MSHEPAQTRIYKVTYHEIGSRRVYIPLEPGQEYAGAEVLWAPIPEARNAQAGLEALWRPEVSRTPTRA